MASSSSAVPFLFSETNSTILPNPSKFFSPHLLSSPLPTNSFFQNFTLKKGDQPEFIHPYLIQSSQTSLSVCHPSRVAAPSFIYQKFVPNITISSHCNTKKNHVISSYSDLSVTLDYPPNLQFFLVRGSPYVTCSVANKTLVSISTGHGIHSVSPSDSHTKHTIKLDNGQTWLFYSSTRINLMQSGSRLTSDEFCGVVRLAILPDPRFETILDRFSSCYPVSGDAAFSRPFCLEYKWETKGLGNLLILAHPLHLQLLSSDECNVEVLDELIYESMDGNLTGVVGDSWVLKTNPIPVSWHSIRGVDNEAIPELVSALITDVEGLNSKAITTDSSYFYGKLIARAARLALIAEEICLLHVIPEVVEFLKDSTEPWLDGKFDGNGFLFDPKWGGIVCEKCLVDSKEDFGFGVYNNHHYHLGHFLYAIAVLARFDPAWGEKYRPQAYSLMADFMNFNTKMNPHYPRLRNFDLWKLHSWAGGLTEFADGRNQQSTSEAVNAYYSAALLGLSYGDMELVAISSTIAAMEIQAAQTWWHVKEGSGRQYEHEFSKQNRVVGVLWANKRDSGLWFAPPDWRECRVGIQVLPLSPITEILFSDLVFVRELVKWVSPALATENWKGFAYALEGLYNKESALQKIRSLEKYDNGNSRTNLLWWIHSRKWRMV
ncbi:hypothetical protein MKW92_027953 [Papaver armeniacum]|nr:hypothetical protein MKW92_027953 [Papaver armeniacum]